MSDYQKGQAVIYTNPRRQKKAGKFIGETSLGSGRGGGRYLLVEVDGKQMKAKPGLVVAA